MYWYYPRVWLNLRVGCPVVSSVVDKCVATTAWFREDNFDCVDGRVRLSSILGAGKRLFVDADRAALRVPRVWCLKSSQLFKLFADFGEIRGGLFAGEAFVEFAGGDWCEVSLNMMKLGNLEKFWHVLFLKWWFVVVG